MSSKALPKAVRAFAPAKINWALTIRRRRDDGFHDIDTVFQTIGVGDELLCRRRRAPECRITCDAPAVPTGGENLIARAWSLMAREYAGRVAGLDVKLKKRVPMGAGLGGGSSDAAAALAAVNRLYGLGVRRGRLEELAGELGSDCAFFVRGGTALGEGRGEKLQRLENRLPALWLVVVFPGFASATAQAYAHVRPTDWTGPEPVMRAARAIEDGQADVLQKSLTNIFSKVVFDRDSRYKSVQDHMRDSGLINPLLSGSGSALFSVCAERELAQRACASLSRLFPWVALTRMRRSGVTVTESIKF